MIKFLFSYKLTLICLMTLAIGASVATFVENDFGTSTARVLVYNNIWYEFVMLLCIVNLIGIIYKRKMYKTLPKFIFHSSFVILLIGAALTRYIGFEGIMHISENQTSNNMISLEPYLEISINDGKKIYTKEYQFDMSAISFINHFDKKIIFNDKVLDVSLNTYTFAKKGKAEMGILKLDASLNGDTFLYKLVGKRGMRGLLREHDFKGIKVSMRYGSKQISLPFAIKLRDFQLDRYPGSKTPSSYASEVTVIDVDNKKSFDYRIYMNHPLHYGGYTFFQSSYDPDERGSVLSVNNDPGKWPTYIGYFLLFLGLILNLFDKNSRFAKLTNYIKRFNMLFISIAILTLSQHNVFAKDLKEKLPTQEKQSLAQYMQDYAKNSKELADDFSRLACQSRKGRMQPLDTLNRDILLKLTSKAEYLGMNANQVLLGMLARPDIWRRVKMFKIKSPKLKKIFNLQKQENAISFAQAFKDDKYILMDEINDASRLDPSKRGTFQKELLKLDEKLNIAYMVYLGDVFTIFPVGHESPSDDATKWYAPVDAMKSFYGKQAEFIETLLSALGRSVSAQKYNEAKKYIGFIKTYQNKIGAAQNPPQNILDAEIFLNKLNILTKATVAYLVLGILFLILSFIGIFSSLKDTKVKTIGNILLSATVFVFLAQIFAMGYRWYIGGHAPWSNTYESLVYIAFSAMAGGLLFFRKSYLALSSAILMAAIFMGTAYLIGANPQITNLVPVLKSYWLTIHVSIITGSYGFFAIGAMLGFFTLILFTFRDENKPHIDQNIRHITAINEAALIIGLSMITIGNFLGGVWANESWGRYWGWDPKETWAWIAILVYVFTLHLRMIPKLNNIYTFAVASLLSFSTILMTYFGVNFYLSGLHSYATGDPVPVPKWVYVVLLLVAFVIITSFRKRKISITKL